MSTGIEKSKQTSEELALLLKNHKIDSFLIFAVYDERDGFAFGNGDLAEVLTQMTETVASNDTLYVALNKVLELAKEIRINRNPNIN